MQLARPVNRFPDFVGEIVHRLKATVPDMGKVRIAQVLARAGLHLSASTAQRLLARPAPKAPPPPEPAPAPARGRAVIARAPHHVWGVDLTVVPTAPGFWVPWAPFSALQRWPFCWVVVVVVTSRGGRSRRDASMRSRRPATCATCSTLPGPPRGLRLGMP